MRSTIEKRVDDMLEGRFATVTGAWTKGRWAVALTSGAVLKVTYRGHVTGRRGDYHYLEAEGSGEHYMGYADVRRDKEITLRRILPRSNVNQA